MNPANTAAAPAPNPSMMGLLNSQSIIIGDVMEQAKQIESIVCGQLDGPATPPSQAALNVEPDSAIGRIDENNSRLRYIEYVLTRIRNHL